MKTLKVYKSNDEYVIERINEFNHSTKRSFITQEGLKEGLNTYYPVMDQYQLEVDPALQELVTKLLHRDKFTWNAGDVRFVSPEDNGHI